MKKLIIASALALATSACSTMYFDNGSEVSTAPAIDSWHHNVFFALAEVSAPVVLDERCRGDDWSSVKTETTFLNGLAGGAVNAMTVIPAWNPQTASVYCSPLARD